MKAAVLRSWKSQVTILRWLSSHGGGCFNNVVANAGNRNDQLAAGQCKDLNISRLASILRQCASEFDLKRGKCTHDYIIKNGLQNDRFISNLLIQMYGRCGAVHEAKKVFNAMKNHNNFSWNIMLTAYTQLGHLNEALLLFRQMPEPDLISWTSMIAAFSQRGFLERAYEFFEQMPERNVVSWTAMISGYAKNGQLDEALRFFQQMPQRNVVSWNAMIEGYMQHRQLDEATKLFQKMPEKNVVSWTIMISGYARHGRLKEAHELFRRMPTRNTVAWTAIISGYAQQGDLEEVLELFQQMQLEGLRPDKVTFVSILDACASNTALAEGTWIYNLIQGRGFEADVVVQTALINLYAKCGKLEDAHKMFDKMPLRTAVSWTTMIVGYAQHGYGKQVLHMLQQAQLEGIRLDEFALCSILSACSHTGLLNEGCHILFSMKDCHVVVPIVEHFNCIIDMLGRVEWLEEAEIIVLHMPLEPGVSTWTTLLGTCRIFNDIERGKRAASHVSELSPRNSASYVLLSNIYAATGSSFHRVTSQYSKMNRAGMG